MKLDIRFTSDYEPSIDELNGLDEELRRLSKIFPFIACWHFEYECPEETKGSSEDVQNALGEIKKKEFSKNKVDGFWNG